MCNSPRENQAHKAVQGSLETLDLTSFASLMLFMSALVAGRGFEPPTFGL